LRTGRIWNYTKQINVQRNVLSVEHFLLPTDAPNVKKRRVIKTF